MILSLDGYLCEQCGKGPPISGSNNHIEVQIAHRVMPEEGGNNSMGNLVTLCIDCLKSRGLEPCDNGIYDGFQHWL